ncbi:MAG: DNA methyltransferase [Clostridia bacterium]
MSNHKIVIGDSRKLNLIADKSVQLIITSPPYWQLKDYGIKNQIGFDNTYEEYINNLNLVWQECFRVLSDGCRMCINIGDQFARSVYYGRYKVIPIRTEIIRFCEALGMDYMGAIIWQKATTMNTTGGGVVMGSFPYPRNGILKMDYEFILLFKKLGNAPKPSNEQKEKSVMTKEEWNQYFASHWNFNGVKQLEHVAMFPEELPRRLIKMFSFVDETIFDPFLGSGTTSLAAINLERNSIGYEINNNFKHLIEAKLANVQINADNKYIGYYEDNIKEQDLSYGRLPYIFTDPHKLNKKIDIKKLTFGSRIDENTCKKEEMFTVKDILSPEIMILNNGISIRLIGIKSKIGKEQDAIDFLIHKTLKKKVYLRFDELKYDLDSNLMCYLYLDNKTFINSHLIRSGYVCVDTKAHYKYKNKFKELINNE